MVRITTIEAKQELHWRVQVDNQNRVLEGVSLYLHWDSKIASSNTHNRLVSGGTLFPAAAAPQWLTQLVYSSVLSSVSIWHAM